MLDMAGPLHNAAAIAASAVAVAGGIVAQTSPEANVGNAGMYVGAGGLAAALALLVSSMGDKLGPHVVAIAKLVVEGREQYIKLKGENLSLAQRIVEMEGRMAKAEADAQVARELANKWENDAIVLRGRVSSRFEAVEATVQDVNRRVDVATGSNDEISVMPADEGSGGPPHPDPEAT